MKIKINVENKNKQNYSLYEKGCPLFNPPLFTIKFYNAMVKEFMRVANSQPIEFQSISLRLVLFKVDNKALLFLRYR